MFDQALEGGGAKNINFQELAADLAQITFDYPFRIPPYFALIIRAIGVLEGIALVGNRGPSPYHLCLPSGKYVVHPSTGGWQEDQLKRLPLPPLLLTCPPAHSHLVPLLARSQPNLGCIRQHHTVHEQCFREGGACNGCCCVNVATDRVHYGPADFAIVDEAYPYVAQRLLTDDSPRLQAALRYMVCSCSVCTLTCLPLAASWFTLEQQLYSSLAAKFGMALILWAHPLTESSDLKFTFSCFRCGFGVCGALIVDADGHSCFLQIYGKEELFDAERVVDLLQALESFSVASASAQGTPSAAAAAPTALSRQTSPSGPRYPPTCLPLCHALHQCRHFEKAVLMVTQPTASFVSLCLCFWQKSKHSNGRSFVGWNVPHLQSVPIITRYHFVVSTLRLDKHV